MGIFLNEKERAAELYKPRWETWLREVHNILSRVQFGHDLESEEAIKVGQRLAALLSKLEAKISEGGNNNKS